MLYVYVISLVKDVKKRNEISGFLNKFNIKFEFIDAIYGKNLSISTMEVIRNKSKGKVLGRRYSATPGEIGCTLSHLEAYKKIVANKQKWACILEDDAILDHQFELFIKEFSDVELEPSNLYLLGGQNGLDQEYLVKSRRKVIKVGGQYFFKTIKSESVIYRTCCYILSDKMANKFINLYQKEYILADDWEYLVDRKLVKKIYLADFVDHPIDLSCSNIEAERSFFASKVQQNSNNRIIFRCIKEFLKKTRLIFLRIYSKIDFLD